MKAQATPPPPPAAGVLLSALAARFGGKVAGGDARVFSVASLTAAGGQDLSFFAAGAPAAALANTRAAAVALRAQDANKTKLPKWIVEEEDPRLAFARAAVWLRPPPPPLAGISPLASVAKSAELGQDAAVAAFAVVEEGARVGANCQIHAGAVVGRGAVLGEGCVLHPRVVLYAGVSLGARCVLHAGAVVGADGFGYAQAQDGERQKMPHFAGVALGDDVEVGANAAIDRGMLDNTVVGDGVKIDNLAQIGHNVTIGARSVVCGNAGIAGGARIGEGCVVGGGAGVAGRVVVGAGARIGGHSAVTADVAPGADVLAVWPAMPAGKWRRLVAAARRGFASQKRRRQKCLIGKTLCACTTS